MNVGVQGEAMNVILHLCNLGLSFSFFWGGPSELLTFVQNPFTFFVHTHQITTHCFIIDPTQQYHFLSGFLKGHM